MEELREENIAETVYIRVMEIVRLHGVARLFCEGLEKYCALAGVEDEQVREGLKKMEDRTICDGKTLPEHLLSTAVKSYLHPFRSLSRRFCQHHIEHNYSGVWKTWFDEVASRDTEFFDGLYLKENQ